MPFSDQHLSFVTTDGDRFTLRAPTLIVAGYTGRDEASVKAHIEELAAIGVPPPESVPAFYPLDPALLTTAPEVEVGGSNTSGEVEPVILCHAGTYYLGVGSDHTDRDVERDSVALAKAACPKPIGTTIIAMSGDPRDWPWDDAAISCAVDGESYQAGTLAAIRRPEDLLARLDQDQGVIAGDWVMFTGTVPLIGGDFVPGTHWHVSLSLADATTLTHTYKTAQGGFDAQRK